MGRGRPPSASPAHRRVSADPCPCASPRPPRRPRRTRGTRSSGDVIERPPKMPQPPPETSKPRCDDEGSVSGGVVSEAEPTSRRRSARRIDAVRVRVHGGLARAGASRADAAPPTDRVVTRVEVRDAVRAARVRGVLRRGPMSFASPAPSMSPSTARQTLSRARARPRRPRKVRRPRKYRRACSGIPGDVPGDTTAACGIDGRPHDCSRRGFRARVLLVQGAAHDPFAREGVGEGARRTPRGASAARHWAKVTPLGGTRRRRIARVQGSR